LGGSLEFEVFDLRGQLEVAKLSRDYRRVKMVKAMMAEQEQVRPARSLSSPHTPETDGWNDQRTNRPNKVCPNVTLKQDAVG
jgi:hypothetical protein